MFEAKLAAEFVNHHEFQCTHVDKISVNFLYPIDEIYCDYISFKCIDIIAHFERR